MTTVYVSLQDPNISEFLPGAGLPNIFARMSTPVDDTTQLPTLKAAAARSAVSLVVSATAIWPVAGGGGSVGGAVNSVNSRTGDVVLLASDVGAVPQSQQVAAIYSGPATPTPAGGSGEYLWFETDGNGNLLDILTGKV